MYLDLLIIPMFAVAMYLISIRVIGTYRSLINKSYTISCDETFTPTISVMMSCFNEGKAVYETIESIMTSDYPRDKIQVVAFDDCSKDDSWEWMQKAAIDFPGTIIDRNSENLGKPHTMLRIAERVTGEILIGTDTDTIFHPRAIRELVSVLADEKIGAVGGIVGIKNVNDTLLTQIQAILYFFSFYFIKHGENLSKTVQCLAGPIVAYRHTTYKNILLPLVKARTFCGEKISYGEDRFITQMILANGLKTYVNHKARCWVGTPTKWGNYFNQQLRWRRGGLESWFRCIKDIVPRYKNAGFMAIANCLLPFFMHSIPLVMMLLLIKDGLVLELATNYILTLLIVFPVLSVVINYLLTKYDSRQRLNNPILATAMFVVFFPINVFFITPWALLTLDDGGWVTRQNGQKGNA